MDVLNSVITAFAMVIQVLRPTVFALGVLTGGAAVLSWAVRTRRIGPFTPLARLSRQRLDPVLFAPMERKLVRSGGTPGSAPWWTVAAVVIGGLLVLWLLQFFLAQLSSLRALSQAGPTQVLLLVVDWVFMVLRLALIVRVISSWVGGGRYSKWWRWSYRLTDWIIIPLQKVVPTIGPIDITPIVAYFGLNIIQWLISSAF